MHSSFVCTVVKGEQQEVMGQLPTHLTQFILVFMGVPKEEGGRIFCVSQDVRLRFSQSIHVMDKPQDGTGYGSVAFRIRTTIQCLIPRKLRPGREGHVNAKVFEAYHGVAAPASGPTGAKISVGRI